MNKLEMAHDYAMQAIDTGYVCETELLVKEAWRYADLMQAEADKREDKTRPAVLQEEWQPDWSVAPDWAKWWAMDADKNCYWYKDKLYLGDAEWDRGKIGNSRTSPSFNYQGNWQYSLRKRPE